MKNRILLVIGILFGRKKYYYFGKILQHIAHRMMGIGNYETSQISGEAFAIDFIHTKLASKKNFTFIDIGAGSESETTELIRKYFPTAKGYLFEPMPITYSKLKNKFKGYKTIFCENKAIDETANKIQLFDRNNKQTQHATSFPRALATISVTATEVNSVRLDTIIKAKKLQHVDFIKIDVEGNELSCIRSLGTYLTKVSFIQFEFNAMNIYSNVRFIDFIDLLQSNFDLYRLYSDGLLPIENYNPIYHEIYEFQNILAVNKKLKFSY